MRETEFSPLDAAQRRLDAALAFLEGRVARADVAPAVDAHARARLEGELVEARARERALEQVAAEASAALGRAAAEVRAALAADMAGV